MSILNIKDANGNFIPVKALNGKTPVKGVDYFTDADKQEIVDYVSENVEISTDNLSTVPINKGGTGATDADTARTNLNAQKELGFTPVQQGGGTNHGNNKIYLGWSNENKLNVQVDGTNLGNLITDATNYGVILPVAKGGTGARDAASARTNLDVYSKTETDTIVSQRDRVVNLLDNSDFTNPVNQRGQTSYEGSGYNIDRWKNNASGGKLEIVDGGIILSHTGSSHYWFAQKFEKPLDESKYYTLYVEYMDGTISVVSKQPGGSTYAINSTTHGTLYTTEISIIPLNGHGNANIKRVALYEGSYTADTVPVYQPKGYAHELTECMRYYQISERLTYGMIADYNGAVSINFQYPIEMRIAPTVTISDIGVFKTTATSNIGDNYTGTITQMSSTKTAYTGYISDQGRQSILKITYKYTANAEL